MPWVIPAPADISDAYSAALEQAFALDANGRAQTIDARGANSVLGIFARTHGLTMFEMYLYQAWLADELMPDTAVDFLSRHANVWGVPQNPPVAAVGNAVFSGANLTPVPSGTLLGSAGGTSWTTTTGGTIGTGGTLSLPVAANVAGAAGNAAAGTPLTVVSPIAGLTTQVAVVDSAGIAGGTDAESVASWRSRILLRIRQPPAGGRAADYVAWAEAAGAAYVNVVPGWSGAGSVGIIVGMAGPAVPNSTQVAAIQAAIGALRPVTAIAVVAPCSLLAVNLTIVLNPDTTALRTAVQAALLLYFQENAAIGGTIYLSQLYAAVLSVAGEASCIISAPAGDTVAGNAQLPVLGTITW
jgi:uncharacterized phage protein gp47/JayE